MNPSETTDPSDDLETAVQTLLAHPALGAWLAWGAAVWSTLDPLPEQQKSAPPAVLISLLLREMARVPNAQALVAGMAAGLRALAIWFWYHEERREAELSARLAAALPSCPSRRTRCWRRCWRKPGRALRIDNCQLTIVNS